jgi:tRNA A-37 threonylcarbamoyl transferase component Bud32
MSTLHYNFAPGRVLARKYEVLSRASARTSGELYMLSERATGIERTAKFFSPAVDPQNRFANYCARKLHKLRHCDILIHYRTQETISVGGRDVTYLVSDVVQGEPLADFLARQPGGRMAAFEGLHLLHAIATGVDKMHHAGEAHGDLTLDNLIGRRKGIGFQVKIIDLSPPIGGHCAHAASMRDDVYDMIRIFHDSIGGPRLYARQPDVVKHICYGMRRQNIAENFRNAGELKRHLETMTWKK